MRFLWRWLRRVLLTVALVLLGLAAPVAYIETMCRGDAISQDRQPIVSREHQRPETRTLMTYPEWHIVHAYADYAEVLRDGDPHDYGFISGVSGFWTSLCALTRMAPDHGAVDGGTKQMVYVIGVSFTAELALKALYEESIGRLSAMLRGPEHSTLDRISAEQAASYAAFLQQTPWYKWPFLKDAETLAGNVDGSWRDTERRAVLGLEYRAKAAYADAIAQAVAQVGPDELTLRMILADVSAEALAPFPTVSVLAERPEGLEVEAPRYRALTLILQSLALDGADFVEIAGNDDIMFTALSSNAEIPDAIYSAGRQGFGDYRHLIRVKVTDLAQRLRTLDAEGLELEHIHDY